MNAPRFITLTIATDGLTLSESIDKLMQSWKKLRRQPEWKCRVKGGVYTVEVTRGKDGTRWHPHLHCIVDGDYFLQRMLSQCWLRVTGDSDIVDIRAVLDRRSVATYIGRYVGKPIGWQTWSLEQISEFARAMQGKRLVHSFGYLHNAKIDHPDELLPKRADKQLCTVSELYSLVERGFPDAMAAFEMMQNCNGPLGALARRHNTRAPTTTAIDATPDVLRKIAALIELALMDAQVTDNPPPKTRRIPPPLLPGIEH